jgi:hypothetical protein
MSCGSRPLWSQFNAWSHKMPCSSLWLSKGMKRRGKSSKQNHRLATIEANPLLETGQLIGQSAPEVKKHPRPLETNVWLTMMLNDGQPRIIGSENAIAIPPTSTISLTTEDTIGQGCSPLHGACRCEHPLHQGETRSMLWHPSSGKSSGLTSSSLDRLISMMAPVTPKNSFRSTTRPLMLLVMTIG